MLYSYTEKASCKNASKVHKITPKSLNYAIELFPRVLETVEEREYYCNGDSAKIAFIMDGGPKVS